MRNSGSILRLDVGTVLVSRSFKILNLGQGPPLRCGRTSGTNPFIEVLPLLDYRSTKIFKIRDLCDPRWLGGFWVYGQRCFDGVYKRGYELFVEGPVVPKDWYDKVVERLDGYEVSQWRA